MKLRVQYLTCILLIAVFPLFAQQTEQSAANRGRQFSVMTFNIRFANPNDKEFAWKHRREMVANTVRLQQPLILGTQEGLHHQVKYLAEALDTYDWVGAGRSDGKTKGEFSAVFYRKDILKLMKTGNFWLSKSPDVAGSTSWNTAITRMCTWAHFKNRRTGKEFYHFNTHWDHVSEEARRESAMLIAEKAEHIAGNHLAFLTGDLNAQRKSKAYRIITEQGFDDTRMLAQYGHLGPDFTHVGFPYKARPGRVIDYVLIKNRPRDLNVRLHTTLSLHTNDYYPSDHLPVIASFSYGQE